jgi:phospholipid/cholesterol/gamma-HCH transport system ATP-binding protein
MTDEAQLRPLVDRCLAMVGLPGVAHQFPAELSGGMKKRIALARAVSATPAIVLYDEPTTGLDPNNVRRISDLIVSLNRELDLTTIVVTHDLSSTFLISDRIAMLAQRRIVEVARPDDFRNSAVPEVREFLSAMPGSGGQTWLSA